MVKTVALLPTLTLPVFSKVMKRNILIDVHVCSAQPFLEEFIEEYGNCDDEIVHLRDGSLLSLHQFMSHVNTSNALTEGVEGVWKKEINSLDSTRTQGKKKHLNDLKWRIPFLLRVLDPSMLDDPNHEQEGINLEQFIFSRHIDPKSKDMEAAVRSVRQLVGLQTSSSCW